MDYHIYPSYDALDEESVPSYQSLRSSVECEGCEHEVPDHAYGSAVPANDEEAPSYQSLCSSVNSRVTDYKREENTPDCAFDGAKPVHLGPRPKNVILFGETGVGKSSVINLMAGENVAKTSSGLDGCTLHATEYSFTFPGVTTLRIFDTVGLEEPEIGVNTFVGAIVKAHQLVESLHSAGGIDLLLFCIRGGRITSAMQRSYRLFFEVLCGKEVPLAIVVTNLEQEDVMENWWVENQAAFKRYGIQSVAHACVTAVSAHVTTYAQKRAESRKALQAMLLEALSDPRSSYLQDSRSWLVAIVDVLRSLLTRKGSLKKKDLSRRLERECKLPRNDAEELARVLAKRDPA